MGIRERERNLQNIARLWRTEKKAHDADVAAVREDLESQLGGAVPRTQAARFLGISHTALNNWVNAGDVPVAISKSGRREIPIPALLNLYEKIANERRLGRRKLHLLEPAMIEDRRRAERMRPRALVSRKAEANDPHRRAELRSLAYHRALAPRLRRPMIVQAQQRLRRWEKEGSIPAMRRLGGRYSSCRCRKFVRRFPRTMSEGVISDRTRRLEGY